MLEFEATMEDAGPNADSLIGQTLGGLYRVERLLGIGGMGRVYQATHTHLGKAFAVKVLSEGRADKPDATERFLREARSATRIDHDHIVKVVNCDRDEAGRLFIVMELLEGESLAERLKRGPVPLDEALEITRQTAEALQAAHDAGIVHRDLKPENVFLAKKNGKDFVKILDFGISKIKNPEHGDPKLTDTDQIVGTPLYISPELARGIPAVDHRTDVYALGVILYEMLTGSPPFRGENHFQLLYKHGNEKPEPPSRRNTDVEIPSQVEAAVLRALEKDPAARFDSMHELREALDRPAHPRRRVPAVAIPLLAAAVAGMVAFVLWNASGVEVPAGEPAPALPQPPVTPTAAPVSAEPPAMDPPVTEKSADPAEPTAPEAPPPQVTIALDSRPKGAWVALNGEKMGRAPIELALDRGAEATVRFSLPGYRTARRRVVASHDQTLLVRLEPKARPEPPPIKTEF